MKRGLATFMAAMTAVGVAGALAFAPGSQPPSQSSSQPPPAEAKLSSASLPVTVPVKPIVDSRIEARQAPVPLVMKKRTPIGQSAVDFDSDVIGPETAGRVGDRSGEGSAKAAIEADGYKSAKVLRKGANGVWYAEAMRGATKVRLIVDSQGNVATE